MRIGYIPRKENESDEAYALRSGKLRAFARGTSVGMAIPVTIFFVAGITAINGSLQSSLVTIVGALALMTTVFLIAMPRSKKRKLEWREGTPVSASTVEAMHYPHREILTRYFWGVGVGVLVTGPMLAYFYVQILPYLG